MLMSTFIDVHRHQLTLFNVNLTLELQKIPN